MLDIEKIKENCKLHKDALENTNYYHIKTILNTQEQLIEEIEALRKVYEAVKLCGVEKATECHGHGDYGEKTYIPLSGWFGITQQGHMLLEAISNYEDRNRGEG